MVIKTREQAWDIWKEHAPAVRAYLQKRTKDSVLTDDLTQEVAIRVYNACCCGKEIKNVRAWLFQIAYHALVDHYKQTERARRCTPPPTSSTQNVYQDLSPFLQPLIEFLPSKYALPLHLADIEGKKQSCIATQLGLSLTATKSRIQRARKLLKAQINTCFYIKERKSSGLVYFELKASCQPLQRIARENF
ncbi:MAG: sigma-70 family RNA polymerase sigma factor [Bacteroidota bacterium]